MMNAKCLVGKAAIGGLMLIFLLSGCGAAGKSTNGSEPNADDGKTEETGKGVIHFPDVNKKDWVTSISKLCVTVDQSYTGLSNLNEPIAEEVEAILERVGVDTTIGTNPDCQAALNISLEMTPVGEDVMGAAGDCYFDASAKGQAMLSASGKKDLKLELERSVSTGGSGFTIVNSCPTKLEANYAAAWANAIAPMFAEWWGAPALVSALGSDYYALSNAAVNQLVKMGSEGTSAIPTLIEMLKDVNPTARSSAARALGRFGEAASEAVPGLIVAADDPDYSVSSAAIGALGEIGDPRGLPVLIEALNGNDAFVRSGAAEAIGKMGADAAQAVPDLVNAIDAEDYNVGYSAIEALGQLGPVAKDAVPALITKLESGDDRFSYWVGQALESITGQEYGEDASAWRKWYDGQK